MKGFGWYLLVTAIAAMLWFCFIGVTRSYFGTKPCGTVIKVEGVTGSVSDKPVLVSLDTTTHLAFCNKKSCNVTVPYSAYSRMSVKPRVKDTVGFRDVRFVVKKVQAVYDMDTLVNLSGKCIQIDL